MVKDRIEVSITNIPAIPPFYIKSLSLLANQHLH
jgi:hypothetical protein